MSEIAEIENVEIEENIIQALRFYLGAFNARLLWVSPGMNYIKFPGDNKTYEMQKIAVTVDEITYRARACYVKDKGALFVVKKFYAEGEQG